MTGDSPPNTTIEYADRLLEEFHRGKKAASVKAGHFLEALIVCTDGTVVPVTGYWACELMKRLHDKKHA